MLEGVRMDSACPPRAFVAGMAGRGNHRAFDESGAEVELLSVAKERRHFPLPMPAD